MKYAAIIATLLLCGCSKTVDYVLPQSPLPAERKPLTVPHRDWIESGCYPKIVNGKETKVCHENSRS